MLRILTEELREASEQQHAGRWPVADGRALLPPACLPHKGLPQVFLAVASLEMYVELDQQFDCEVWPVV